MVILKPMSTAHSCAQPCVGQSGNDARGFTLVEVMIVVAIIGLLTAIALPAFLQYRQDARVALTVNDLRIFSDGFRSYQMKHGAYPPDSHIILPNVEMERYIDPAVWNKPIPIGGRYNWEGPSWGQGGVGNYEYAGIALFETTASAAALADLDAKCDDGNLTTGRFRLTPNGRYTYLIEERLSSGQIVSYGNTR